LSTIEAKDLSKIASIELFGQGMFNCYWLWKYLPHPLTLLLIIFELYWIKDNFVLEFVKY